MCPKVGLLLGAQVAESEDCFLMLSLIASLSLSLSVVFIDQVFFCITTLTN